jgi:hypothetical protein
MRLGEPELPVPRSSAADATRPGSPISSGSPQNNSDVSGAWQRLGLLGAGTGLAMLLIGPLARVAPYTVGADATMACSGLPRTARGRFDRLALPPYRCKAESSAVDVRCA